MRSIFKLAAAAALAFVGFAATSASADDVKIGFGANVTINVYNCCGARQATRPIAVAPERTEKVVKPIRAPTHTQKKVIPNKVAPVKAAAIPATAATGNAKCLNSTSASTYTINWVKEDRGSCPGSVSAADIAKLATMAASGIDEMWVAFEIPTKCDSGFAKMPVKVEGKRIKLFPWRKTCVAGDFAPRAR